MNGVSTLKCFSPCDLVVGAHYCDRLLAAKWLPASPWTPTYLGRYPGVVEGEFSDMVSCSLSRGIENIKLLVPTKYNPHYIAA